MTTRLLTFVVLIFALLFSCGKDDDDIAGEDVNPTELPTQGGSEEYDHSNYGTYVAMIAGGSYIAADAAATPDYFGISGMLTIAIDQSTTATLWIDDQKESFTVNQSPTLNSAINKLQFNGTNNSTFWFSVDANGGNPAIDSIKAPAFVQTTSAPTSGENPLHGTVLKSTSDNPVAVYTGEAIFSLRPHTKVCAITKGGNCYFDFGGTYRSYDFGAECIAASLLFNDISYNAGGKTLNATIHDEMVLSGSINSDLGLVPFSLLNTAAIPEFKLLLSDPANDNSPAGIPGSDFRTVSALATENYVCIKVSTSGNIADFLEDNSSGLSTNFILWTPSEVDDVFVGRDEAMIKKTDNSFVSFAQTNNYAVRGTTSFYVFLDKQWCVDSANEFEFSLASNYTISDAYDTTDNIILKIK
ncbi:hypothetical protein [Mangrovibacterium marinum]|uniref:Uncharacterized protein n=1 Tax=Mangrovibacterium marinum TaxID=1639118 RepID=A0A2T5BZY5_9BACT|nr:hypothetical protein [Mangrovibacterium marinum]PTN07864.1 hypothetical protein C8N47_11226 [Mangrovibacterium marinum]